MTTTRQEDRTLHTSVGSFPLLEYRAHLADRDWSILHTGAILSLDDEMRFLFDEDNRRPYGVVLWPAAIAMGHDLAARGTALHGAQVLELGAGTGLPGLVAAAQGAQVTQTDRQEVALSVCRRNAERNGITSVVRRQLEWDDSALEERYDWIIGSDIAYAQGAHAALRRLFAAQLTPSGRVLLSDPFRAASLPLLRSLEEDGWTVQLSKWTVAVDDEPRMVGVYELSPPRERRA